MLSIPKGVKSAQSFECGFVERCPPQAALGGASSPKGESQGGCAAHHTRACAGDKAGEFSLPQSAQLTAPSSLGLQACAERNRRRRLLARSRGGLWCFRGAKAPGGWEPLAVCPLRLPFGQPAPPRGEPMEPLAAGGGCSEKIPHRGEFFQPGGSVTLPYGGVGGSPLRLPFGQPAPPGGEPRWLLAAGGGILPKRRKKTGAKASVIVDYSD